MPEQKKKSIVKKQAEKLAEYAEQQKAIDEGTKAQAKNAKDAERTRKILTVNL